MTKRTLKAFGSFGVETGEGGGVEMEPFFLTLGCAGLLFPERADVRRV